MHTRFIVFGQSRSGSTLVQELLNSHPQICCEGELLNPEWGYLGRGPVREFSRLFPAPYLNHRARARGLPNYGCKLMPYHLRFPVSAVRRLVTHGWKIIHVHRRDVPRQSLSKLVAEATGRWHSRSDQLSPLTGSVTIPVEALLREIQKRRQIGEMEKQVMAQIPHFPVCFETDLQGASDRDVTFGHLFTYLKVEPAAVYTTLVKTHDLPDEQFIANYDEIQPYLNGQNQSNMG